MENRKEYEKCHGSSIYIFYKILELYSEIMQEILCILIAQGQYVIWFLCGFWVSGDCRKEKNGDGIETSNVTYVAAHFLLY